MAENSIASSPYVFQKLVCFRMVYRPSNTNQRDIAVRFVLDTENEGVFLSVGNVFVTDKSGQLREEHRNDARPNAFASGNDALTATSGSSESRGNEY